MKKKNMYVNRLKHSRAIYIKTLETFIYAKYKFYTYIANTIYIIRSDIMQMSADIEETCVRTRGNKYEITQNQQTIKVS